MKSAIFSKTSSKKTPYDELGLSSSIFTSSTPTKSVIDDNTESEYIGKQLSKIHKSVLDSDFLPLSNTETENTLTGGHTTSSARHTSSAKHTSSARHTTSSAKASATISIPKNYSETSTNISPYYSSDYVYKSSSSKSSSSYSSTSSDTDLPIRKKKPVIKKTKKTKTLSASSKKK